MTQSTFALLLALPWMLFAVGVPILLRRRPRLRDAAPPAPAEAPLVSIIVPARNEAENISACVSTLFATDYPNREIIVVDDGSTDGTADIARLLQARSDGRFRLVEGQPLPAGWLGKCWACWQGYHAAKGDLLVFTDADTRHDDELLGHAVGALLRTPADLVSILPRQLMDSFWERLVLPHIFVMISLRYRDPARINRSRDPRDVIANGQFLLFRREAYQAIGGHRAVRHNVTEDLALAQKTVATGRRLFLAHAEELMDTRMYRSFAGLVEGWSKNLALGARQTVPPWIRPVLPWLLALAVLVFWVAPPAVLIAAITGLTGGVAGRWALITTVVSVLFWTGTNARMRVPLLHALLFPLGGLVTGLLFVRSAARGERVHWRGRTYRLGAGFSEGD